MSMFGASHKFTITRDANGVPNGVGNVQTATILDGILNAAIGVVTDSDTKVTGMAATVGQLANDAIVASLTSKYVSGSFMPRKLA